MTWRSPLTWRPPLIWGLLLLLLGGLTSCVVAGTSVPPRDTSADPPLTATSAGYTKLPAVGAFADLTEYEKRIIAAELRRRVPNATEVRILPTLFELCITGDPASTQAQLQTLFSQPADLAVNDGCRPFSRLGVVGTNAVRTDLIRGGSIDFETFVASIINAFPRACGVEINASSRLIGANGRVRNFEAHERRIVSSKAFKGIVIKELISVRIENVTPGATAVVSLIDLSVESKLFWRRLSSPTWSVVSTITHLDPAMVAGGENSALGRCHRGLLSAVVQ